MWHLLFPALHLTMLINDTSELERWWDGKNGYGAHPVFAHIKYSSWLGSENKVVRNWRRVWLDSFASRHALSGAHVMEYGIGGGLLADYLLGHCGVSVYTGIDIANRSLSATRQRLNTFPASRWLLLRTPQEFGVRAADIFISLAVVQHFPSKGYTDDFFQNLERSRVRVILLQIKEAEPEEFIDVDSGSAFDKKKYDSRVTHATRVNTRYMLGHLISYNITWKSELLPHSQVVYEFSRTRG